MILSFYDIIILNDIRESVDMIETLKIALLSLLYGVTSLLPASSLGHFSLLKEVLGYTDENFNASFYYALFSIAAGLAMYINCIRIHKGIVKNTFCKKEKVTTPEGIAYRNAGKNMLLSLLPLIILFVPTGKNGFVGSLGSYFLSDNSLIFVGVASIFCAVLMFISLWYIKTGNAEKRNLISAKNAVFFGLYQIPAYIFPGLSHISLGVSRTAISDVNIKNILKEAYVYIAPAFIITGASRVIFYFNSGEGLNLIGAIVGFAVSFVLSMLMISFINKFFSNKTYKAFAIYNLVFGLVVTGTSLYAILA